MKWYGRNAIVAYVSGVEAEEILEKEGYSEVLFYDAYDDEAPMWRKIHELPNEWCIVEVDKEEKIARIYLDRERSIKETFEVVLRLVAQHIEEEMAIVGREFRISWGGREDGWCDSDGGQYCYTMYPVVWKNPVTKRIEYYMLTKTSCEICEEKMIVMLRETGELIDIEERYFDENMHEEIYRVTVGNIEDLSEPYHDINKFVEEWWEWALQTD